jgi:hypothetical protein
MSQSPEQPQSETSQPTDPAGVDGTGADLADVGPGVDDSVDADRMNERVLLNATGQRRPGLAGGMATGLFFRDSVRRVESSSIGSANGR